MIDMSDDDDDLLNDEESGEPLSLFSLEDKSFPFVCTYDQLLRLLDNTIQLAHRPMIAVNDNTDCCTGGPTGRISFMVNIQAQIVLPKDQVSPNDREWSTLTFSKLSIGLFWSA